jgi:TonB-linked SusC/RagA family outer membrane protein
LNFSARFKYAPNLNHMTKIITQFFKRVFTINVLLVLIGYHTYGQGSNPDSAVLAPGSQDQTIHLLYGSRPKKFVTGAVSSISGSEVSNVPGTNRINSFSGRLPGLSVTQNDGLPGTEGSFFQVRGFHSFVGSAQPSNISQPLILINGRRDDFSMIEPNDIESISILKDAATTALYGLNSSNGLILITTKRGRQGKIKVNYNMESSFQQPTRAPKFLDAYNYAKLYNEAQLNDNPAATPKFNATSLEGYRTGSNPYLYPNVNWSDEILKDFSLQIRNNINVSGGTDLARYYFSGSYLNDNGVFNVDRSINTYNTNNNLNVFNVRANIDVKVAKNLSLFTDLRSKREKRNQPGAYSESYDENVFGVVYGTPANAYPVKNENGSLGGTTDYTNSPYGMLHYSGYSNFIITSLSTFSELKYDFGNLVKGLKLRGNFGFTSYTHFSVNRTKNFEVYQLNTAVTPNTYTRIGANTNIVAGGGYNARYRIFDHALVLDYAADFGDHSITSLLMYDRQQLDNGQEVRMTQNFQGPKASLSYRFKNRYLVDLAASYQGSEQYPKGDRYGLFPAVSAGWIISDEPFMKGNGGGLINFLKIRGSYGRTGNPASDVYYAYLGSYKESIAAPFFGAFFNVTPSAVHGIYQNQIANPLVTWEKSQKINVGLDIALLNNRLNASFDYFSEKTKDILVSNAITNMFGAQYFAPDGAFKNRGAEIQLGWADQIKDFQYSVTANYSIAKNEVVNKSEELKEFPWMYETGNPLNTQMGYVFDRLFTETDNLGSLPDQSSLGFQRPGDLKYKDLNGDNVIDFRDVTVIGNAKIPQSNFGLNLGSKYKGIDLNVFFQGTRGGSTYNSGPTYNEFVSGRGSVLQHHLDRWTPGSGQSAGYPRLTLSNANNFVKSSYWVKDNSFIRLKYVEMGYTLPVKLVNKIGVSAARLFVNGNNMFLWDKVGQKDPEAQDNGLSYPIQRSFSIGLNVKF